MQKKAILDPKLYKTFKGEYKYFNNKNSLVLMVLYLIMIFTT